MNREQLINYGRELETIWEVSDLEAKYEIWKEYVLEYVRENQLDVEKYRMLMYAVADFMSCHQTAHTY